MLKTLSVNLNFFNDCIEIVLDDLIKSECDFLLFCGDNSLYKYILSSVNKPSLYLGEYPLLSEEIGGVCSLVAYVVNGNTDFELKFLEDENNKIINQNNELSKLLIGYIESKESYSSTYFLRKLLVAPPPNSLFLISMLRDIKPYLDYDYLLTKIFTTEIGCCISSEMSEDLFIATKNKTIHNVIIKTIGILPINDFFKPLRSLFNEYIILCNSKDEVALLLYSAIFMNLATFNKNRGDASISYLYLQRCVEISLIYYFLKRNSVFIDSDKRLCFSADAEIVKGVGPLLNLFFKGKSLAYEKQLWNLNKIRNRSIIGHGLYIPSKSQFDSLYLSVDKMLSDLIKDNNDVDFFTKSKKCLKTNAKSQIIMKIKDVITI